MITEITDMPEGTIGFVYMITNKEDGKFYIGKKSLYSHRTLPPLKGYKRKRKVIKESNWGHYNSSNKGELIMDRNSQKNSKILFF